VPLNEHPTEEQHEGEQTRRSARGSRSRREGEGEARAGNYRRASSSQLLVLRQTVIAQQRHLFFVFFSVVVNPLTNKVAMVVDPHVEQAVCEIHSIC